MKKTFIVLMLFILFSSFNNPTSLQSKNNLITIDTVIKAHVIDGIISEWSTDKFINDKGTDISYAVENDATNLFVALKISNLRTQYRLLKYGMNLFIDLKGKHKESTTIEFPLKSTINNGSFSVNEYEDKKSDLDPKKFNEQFALKLLFMKVSGFEGEQEEKTVGLINDNFINVATDRDEANTMYVEYGIPLKELGTVANLTGKKISIGIKLNAPDNTAQRTVQSMTSAPASGRGSRSGGGGGESVTSKYGSIPQNTIQELYIWSKYDFKF